MSKSDFLTIVIACGAFYVLGIIINGRFFGLPSLSRSNNPKVFWGMIITFVFFLIYLSISIILL